MFLGGEQMIQPELRWTSLERRIERLESQNRKLRIGILLVATLTTLIFTTAFSKSGTTVEAQRFLLTNSRGEIRGELTTLEDQLPELTLNSPDGTKITEVSSLGVSVSDRSLPGKLPLSHFGDTGLYLTDEQGRVLIEVGGASVAEPQLAPMSEAKMFDKSGHVIWRAP